MAARKRAKKTNIYDLDGSDGSDDFSLEVEVPDAGFDILKEMIKQYGGNAVQRALFTVSQIYGSLDASTSTIETVNYPVLFQYTQSIELMRTLNFEIMDVYETNDASGKTVHRKLELIYQNDTSQAFESFEHNQAFDRNQVFKLSKQLLYDAT